MSQHMVIFQNPDGHPGYNQFESIEDAVGFVEKIRNEQGIDSVRIFELNEVKFEMKPYYRVELKALNAGAPSRPTPQPAAQPATQSVPQTAPPSAAPESRNDTPPAAADTSSSPFAAPDPAPRADAAATTASAPSPAHVPPADQPESDDQPTRRGLFGR